VIRELTYCAPGRFEWRERPRPVLDSTRAALVRPLAVARCDLDLYIARGIVPFAGPIGFGHESVGEVVEAGEASGVVPGERVVVPFQISCGTCDNCRRGFTGSCQSVAPYAAYGLSRGGHDYGGALADLMHVPFADAMLVKLPDGVDPVAAASLCDNIADGWRGVGPALRERPGASVLVIGGLAQSVGLYAAGCALAEGAGRVVYLDDDPTRRARAEALGVEAAPLALGEGREPTDSFDIVVEAAGDAAALQFAIASAAPNALLTIVSIHLAALTPVPLTAAYYKGLTIRIARVDSRATIPHALECLACKGLRADAVTHAVLPFADAGEAMTDPAPKLVFVP